MVQCINSFKSDNVGLRFEISYRPGSSAGERCPEEAVVPGSNPGQGMLAQIARWSYQIY